jgi:hypothetical protein
LNAIKSSKPVATAVIINIYSIVFDRLYKVFGKGAGTDEDGVVFTSVVLGCLMFANIGIVYILLRYYFYIPIGNVKTIYGTLSGGLLIGFNIYYFLNKERYFSIRKEIDSKDEKRKNLYSLVTILYSFLSIVLFFVLGLIKSK